MKYFSDTPKEKFESIDYFLPEQPFNGFVIVPTGELHDSGYCCMKFVLSNGNDIVGCVGGGCDVVRLNGIGGYGKYGPEWKTAVETQKIKVTEWNMDMLQCGLIRVFSNKELELDDIICSEFNIFSKEERR